MKRLAASFVMVGLLACRPEEREPAPRKVSTAEAWSAKPEPPTPSEPVLTTRREGSERPSSTGTSAWQTADACEFRNGPAVSQRPPSDRVRIASWNVRWFPDSVVDPTRAGVGTDIAWLSCAVVDLDAPVIAVQEFRKHETARRKASQLIESLNRRTGGDWMLELDRCPDANETHVGFLYDARRVAARGFRNIDQLNPKGGCSAGLHPGFAGYFRFPGGLDISLVSVHLMWGTQAESLELRRQARLGMRDAGTSLLASGDADLLVLGDFNTNGCTDCAQPMDPSAEVREAASDVTRGWPRLTLLENDIGCTEYDGGVPLPLDHVVASTLTEELPKNASVRVSGMCPELGCQRLDRDTSEFHARLSDHCPIVVELVDRDWD